MSARLTNENFWTWHLTALVYEWSYVQGAHQTNTDLFDSLGERIKRPTVADCGCGRGLVTEKLRQAGAARVIAVDANAGMVKRAQIRLAMPIAQGHLRVYQAN